MLFFKQSTLTKQLNEKSLTENMNNLKKSMKIAREKLSIYEQAYLLKRGEQPVLQIKNFEHLTQEANILQSTINNHLIELVTNKRKSPQLNLLKAITGKIAMVFNITTLLTLLLQIIPYNQYASYYHVFTRPNYHLEKGMLKFLLSKIELLDSLVNFFGKVLQHFSSKQIFRDLITLNGINYIASICVNTYDNVQEKDQLLSATNEKINGLKESFNSYANEITQLCDNLAKEQVINILPIKESKITPSLEMKKGYYPQDNIPKLTPVLTYR